MTQITQEQFALGLSIVATACKKLDKEDTRHTTAIGTILRDAVPELMAITGEINSRDALNTLLTQWIAPAYKFDTRKGQRGLTFKYNKDDAKQVTDYEAARKNRARLADEWLGVAAKSTAEVVAIAFDKAHVIGMKNLLAVVADYMKANKATEAEVLAQLKKAAKDLI